MGRRRRGAGRASPARVGVARPALGLFLLLLAVYACNFRMLAAGDSIPTRLLPFSIVREGDLDLDEFSFSPRSDGGLPYYVTRIGGHTYSGSPLVIPLLVAPFYAAPAWALAAAGIPYDDVRARVVVVVMERLSAASLAALSAVLLFVVLCRLVERRWAVALTLLYAFGTSTWSISSQALWPQSVSELALAALSAIFVARAPSRRDFVLAGVICALAVANRPPMIGFALLTAVYVWRHHRRGALAFAALPVLGALGLLAVNLAFFGRPWGGYAVSAATFESPLLTGLAGLLASPNRGLFVFTPVMVFAAWGAVRVWRVRCDPWLRVLSAGVAFHLLFFAKVTEWWAGYTYGPRYMTDVLPALTLFLVYGLLPYWRVPVVRPAAVLLALYGVAVQAVGVYAADDMWNREPVPLEVAPQRVWDWSDMQIVRALGGGWRGGELAAVMADAFRDPVAARVEPISAADLASAISVRGLSRELPRGSKATGTAVVTNRGSVAWPAFSGEGVISSRYLIFLVARWLAQGRPVEGLGDVIALPENVAPGETVEVPLVVAAPPVPGDYALELRVSQALDGRSGRIGTDALVVPVRIF